MASRETSSKDHTKVSERCSDTTTCKDVVVVEGVVDHTFKYDNVEICTLKTKMVCALSSKFCLMAPHWLGIQEREQGVQKHEQFKWNIDDKEGILLFDSQNRKFAIKPDLKMLVVVLTVNPGVKKCQCLTTTFFSLTQEEEKLQWTCKDFIELFLVEED